MAKIAVMTGLSKREEEIARLAATGLSNRKVAQRLSLSQHTVENHLLRVYEKLGISTRIELVLYILSRYKTPESEEINIAERALKIVGEARECIPATVDRTTPAARRRQRRKKGRVVLTIPLLESFSWLLGVEFDSPGNFWEIENPPADWSV